MINIPYKPSHLSQKEETACAANVSFKWSCIYRSAQTHKYAGSHYYITKQMAATNLPLFTNSHFTRSVIKSQWTRGSPYIPITKAGEAVISLFSIFYENILSRRRLRGVEGLVRQIETMKRTRSQRQWAQRHRLWQTGAPTVFLNTDKEKQHRERGKPHVKANEKWTAFPFPARLILHAAIS